jgi:hypothetical protein
METKVKIKEASDSGKTFGNEGDKKPIFDVWCENDSKQYTCFNPDILKKVGQEVDVTITEKPYKDTVNYILSLKKEGFGGKPFVKQNTDKHKALECAVTLGIANNKSSTEILVVADIFLKWLKD